MAKKDRSVSIIYQERDHKAVLTATGAYGGPSPDGASVVAHLYVEYGTVPSIITHDVDEHGAVDLKKGDAIRRGDATREVVATLVLSPEAASALGTFLQEKAALAIAARRQNFRAEE